MTDADIVVVADRPNNTEMHYLKRKGIPWMDLADLQKMVDREVSLADIVETVSYAKKLDQLPPDTPNAPPDSDHEGFPWGTSDATDKSIKYTNFSLHHIAAGYLRRQEEKNLHKTARELASLDPNNIPAGSHYLLEIDIKSTEQSFSSISYWVLAMKAAQKERFIKQKRNRQQRRRDGMYGRNWTPITTLQAAVSTGKRDHSSMVAAPQRQQLKRTTEGARSNTTKMDATRNKQLLAPTTTI